MNLVGEGKDRQNLNMNERDVELLQAVHASGCPAATVLMHGRPFVNDSADEYSDAILDAYWYRRIWRKGGFMWRALFGDINPSGKLTISVPRSQGAIAGYLSKKTFF